MRHWSRWVKPKRVRVDLFNGPPPYDHLPKEARVAFWLLRPNPERRSGEHWILTHYRRGEGRTREEGQGWENGSITLLGVAYEFAQQNWDRYQATISGLKQLRPTAVIRQPGFRPVKVKQAIGQVNAEWRRFLNSFEHRLLRDRQVLTDGNWPVPERWPLPWEG